LSACALPPKLNKTPVSEALDFQTKKGSLSAPCLGVSAYDFGFRNGGFFSFRCGRHFKFESFENVSVTSGGNGADDISIREVGDGGLDSFAVTVC